MLGFKDLKDTIVITEKSVECPVKGCTKKVKRQRDRFQKKKRFMCPEHNIYISPSTFEYEREMDNLLWRHYEDLHLLNRVKRVKAESRMARERSEDAVTWNVFRFLDLQDLATSLFSTLLEIELEDPEMIYWSYHSGEKAVFSELVRARGEFGEKSGIKSEPDIIINSRDTLLFLEAKLSAGNKVKPKNEEETKKYLTGGQSWFARVFRSDYETVAVKEEKYELMRLWLLGTWMAAQRGVDFYLLNLVREGQEEGIEVTFGKHINEDPARIFKRITWEKIYKGIADSYVPKEGKEKIIAYLENKTLGYDSNGRLQKAFKL